MGPQKRLCNAQRSIIYRGHLPDIVSFCRFWTCSPRFCKGAWPQNTRFLRAGAQFWRSRQLIWPTAVLLWSLRKSSFSWVFRGPAPSFQRFRGLFRSVRTPLKGPLPHSRRCSMLQYVQKRSRNVELDVQLCFRRCLKHRRVIDSA